MAKMLIVDDSNLSRRTLRSILEPEGHQILEAKDGIAAIEQYFLDKPDLVLLDLVMPELDGFGVLEKLREMDAQARIVIVSADIQTLTKEATAAAGAKAFINKPLSAVEVLTVVNQVLAKECCHDHAD